MGALNSIGALGTFANSGNVNRDGSNDPYEINNGGNGNGGQRIDTGGGEYLHNEE
jgi:hypothetical protein